MMPIRPRMRQRAQGSLAGKSRWQLVQAIFHTFAPSRRTASWQLMGSFFAILTLFLSGIVPNITAAQSRAVITVNAAEANGSLTTRLSTNLRTSFLVSRSPEAQAKLASYAPPLVRIHAGTDDAIPVLPAARSPENWDFSALDDLVKTVGAYGGEPVLNVRYAPDWMWTCTNFHDVGELKDPTYNEFADYMARLVSYYNKGSLTTESGTVIVNPEGDKNRITHWEIWNEPGLSSETPCRRPNNGPSLSPIEYATMWNAVVPEMRAVDPTIQLVALGLDDALSDHNSGYVSELMARATYKPDVISYHVYGGWQDTHSDREIFDGSVNVWGLTDITRGVPHIRALAGTTPIWISELNVNADTAVDPNERPWTAFGVAWGASAYRLAVLADIPLIQQFEFISTPQFGLVDAATQNVTLPYWRDRLLSQMFPAGSTILSSSSSQAEIESLTVRRPDGTVAVLVINRQTDSATSVGGSGLPATITVDLKDVKPTSLVLHQIDSTTSAVTGPVPRVLAVDTPPEISFPGYGIAVLEVTPAPLERVFFPNVQRAG